MLQPIVPLSDAVFAECVKLVCVFPQFELVAELFTEKAAVAPAAPGQRPKGGVLRAAKDVPRAGQKAHRKSVGSQVRMRTREMCQYPYQHGQSLSST